MVTYQLHEPNGEQSCSGFVHVEETVNTLTSGVSRKIIIYERDGSLCIDFKRKTLPFEVDIPVYPMVDDFIMLDNNDIVLVEIVEDDLCQRVEIIEPGLYRLRHDTDQTTEDWNRFGGSYHVSVLEIFFGIIILLFNVVKFNTGIQN